MGIEDRQYYRDDAGGGFFAAAGSAVKALVGLCLGVFVLQIVTGAAGAGGSPLQDFLRLDLGALQHGQVWRLVTYGFCHDPHDLLHLIFNMYLLWSFGSALEGRLGSREFTVFYLGGVLAAALAFVAMNLVMQRAAYVIGASGGVMAVMALVAWYDPKGKVLLFGLIPLEMWLLVTLIVGFEMWPLLGEMRGGASSGVAHAAHLGGLAFGLAYGKFGWRLAQFSPDLWFSGNGPRLPRRRPNLRVYDEHDDRDLQHATAERAERAELDRQVDLILTKISEQGEASLTNRERKTLEEASRRYRKPL